jgi:outer membrane protein assembly factor BamB
MGRRQLVDGNHLWNFSELVSGNCVYVIVVYAIGSLERTVYNLQRASDQLAWMNQANRSVLPSKLCFFSEPK